MTTRQVSNSDEAPPPEDAAPKRQARATTTGTATSRARQVRAAVRKPAKARVALSGASGSGKTWTGLCIAEILAPGGRIRVIDTEPSDDLNTASELYADTFSFDIIDWRLPPYDPRDLALTIRELGQLGETDVLLVDSGSAFWRGEGGTLDVAGGNFGGWRTATPAQNDLVAAILNAPFHVIFCTRAKQEYLVEEGGKKVTKLGLAPIQRDDLEYEFQVVGMIDQDHRIDIGKTRCDDLAGKSFHANKQAEFAEILKRWLDRGPDQIRQFDIDLIVAALKLVEQGPKRKEAGDAFKAAWGMPEALPPDRLPAVWAWLADKVDVDPHQFTEAQEVSEEGDLIRCEECTLGARAGWHTATPPVTAEPPAAPVEDEESTDPPEGGTGAQDASPDPEEPIDPESSAAGAAAAEEDAEPPATEEEPLEPAEVVEGAPYVVTDEDRARTTTAVKALTPLMVNEALTRRALPVTGPPAALRKRLVEYLLDVAEGNRVDPDACGECGGYLGNRGPVPPGKDWCDCPI